MLEQELKNSFLWTFTGIKMIKKNIEMWLFILIEAFPESKKYFYSKLKEILSHIAAKTKRLWSCY